MPYASRQQARWAHVTDQPFADRWDKLTDFSKLPKRVQRIRSRKVKGCTCGEATKEQIAPGITRIRGNLCNVHGKYGPCDKALSKKPKGGKGKAPKGGKPKQTPEQRAQARTQQQQANADNVAKQMAENDAGLSPSGSKALLAFAKGQQPDAQTGDQLAKMGLAERAEDGSYRMTPTGRAVVNAMRAGDYQRAVDAISRGTDTSARRGERQSAAQQRRQDVAGKRAAAQMDRQLRQQEREQRRQAAQQAKPAKAGSGGEKRQEAPQSKRQQRLGRRGGGGGPTGATGASSSTAPAKKPAQPKPENPEKTEPQIAPALQQAVQALSDGADVSDTDIQKLITNGLVKLNKDGTPVLTAAGQRVTKKESPALLAVQHLRQAWALHREHLANPNAVPSRESADAEMEHIEAALTALGAPPAEPMEHEQMETTKAGSPGDYLVVEDRTKPSTWHLQVRRNGKPDHGLMGGAWAALHGGYRGNKYAGPNKEQALSKLRALYAAEKMPLPTEKSYESFTVYKDASGVDRWLSVSSTAYRDRDQEIVSTKALRGAVALADASGFRGPLRFWHVPGIELGDCDYQATAQDGRFLIESGTFRSPALAAAIKSHADEYQMSIGFTHPPNEPDDNGVFTHIAIFERSLVPRGRASNSLTHFALVTKESRMLTEEKQAQLTKLLDGNAELLSGLLGSIATTDKAAQDHGVVYKDAPDLRAIIREELASLLGQTTKDDATEKAAMPMMDMADQETPEEDMAESGMEAPGEENMLTPAEIQAVAQAVVEALGPALNIESKMAGYLNEMKGLMGGMAAKKDAETAEIKADLAAVKAQVADLSGSQPRIMAGGFRASQSPATITTDETKLKDAQPAADPVAESFGAFMADMGFTGPVAPGA